MGLENQSGSRDLYRSSSIVSELMSAPDMDLLSRLRLCDVIGRLHLHERVHLYTDGFLNTQGHFSRKIGFALSSLDNAGLDTEVGSGRQREAGGRNDLGPNNPRGVAGSLSTWFPLPSNANGAGSALQATIGDPDTRARAYQEFERYMFERIALVDMPVAMMITPVKIDAVKFFQMTTNVRDGQHKCG